MMDWTDRHCRMFHRALTKSAVLYTEMVTAAALVHGEVGRLLGHDPAEHPLALQVGGADPAQMAYAARLAALWGFAEVNINVGCPSDRVQEGRFGACLMAEPAIVAACVRAMRDAAPDLPVTVKTRIGIDHHDSFGFTADFVGAVADAGCHTVIIHARKAWLNGLSPKQNREVPPLDHGRVRAIKRAFPDLEVILNGGLRSVADCQEVLSGPGAADGVMIGRAAYETPWLLADVDSALYGRTTAPPSRRAVVEAVLPYVARQLAAGVALPRITRHMMGLMHGLPGARSWRRILTEDARARGAGPEVLLRAADAVGDAALAA